MNEEIEVTPEQIAQHYSAAMDSVNLINDYEAKTLPLSADEEDRVERNKEHLKIMLAKTFWTTEDLTPFEESIK
jgi:hypothetical protein